MESVVRNLVLLLGFFGSLIVIFPEISASEYFLFIKYTTSILICNSCIIMFVLNEEEVEEKRHFVWRNDPSVGKLLKSMNTLKWIVIIFFFPWKTH